MSEKPAPENIERAREARQESFRAALTEAAKAQQEASSVTFAVASESGRGWDPDAHLIPIAKAIAAAEERGRRAWIEDLRAIQQLAEWAVDAVAAEAGRQGGDQLGREAAHAGRINLDRLRERIAALAPRDSGKENT